MCIRDSYCEKARWALDMAAVDYQEEGHAPLFHWLFVLPRTRTKTVPVLIVEGRSPLTESSDIMRYASAFLPHENSLFPERSRAQVDALVERFDRQLGPATRRLGYCYVAKNPALFGEFIATLPRVERAIVAKSERVMRAILGRAFKVSDGARDRTRAKVLAEFAFVEERLAAGAYLVGDTFTAADLTFAALAAPILQPGIDIQALRARDAGFADLVAGLRATTAGEFALRVIRDHRPIR